MAAISVSVRLRPDINGRHALTISENNISVQVNSASSNGLQNYHINCAHIFDENSTQEDVFIKTTVPLLDNALDGNNACIFAYGQTGAGKTYTLFNTVTNYESRGICLRTAAYLFEKIRRINLKEDSTSVRLSVLEIYNEHLIDLLRSSAPSSSSSSSHSMNITSHIKTTTTANVQQLSAPKLTIVEKYDGIFIPNLYILPLSSEDEALDLLYEATSNRKIAEHQLNRQSSRSHIIYTYYLTRIKPSVHADAEVIESKVHVVDLAGSEKTTATKSEKEVLQQANYINKSLSFLEQVVIALTQSNRSHIPYRQSKLTHALKDCLGGNCSTHLIACVWPNEAQAWETLSTLKFANRMQAVENKPSLNSLTSKDDTKIIAGLKNKVNMLKRELIARDQISGSSEQWLPELSAQQKLRSYVMLETFLLSTQTSTVEETLSINSLTQVDLLLQTMRTMLMHICDDDSQLYAKRVRDVMDPLLLKPADEDDSPQQSMFPPLPSRIVLSTVQSSDASKDAINARILDGNPNPEQVEVPLTMPVVVPPTPTTTTTSPPPPVTLDDFKVTQEGSQLCSNYEEIKVKIIENKTLQKELVSAINVTKQRIDDVTQSIEDHLVSNNKLGSIPVEDSQLEESRTSLKQVKSEYRSMVADLKLHKEELGALQHGKQQALASFLNAFEMFSKL